MRAEPSISPLTLGICCAVVAGALAVAPGRSMGPVAPGRGADIVALEGEAMNGDQQPTTTDDGPGPDGVVDEVQVLGRMISRAESSQGDDVATSCTEDCGVQPPAGVPTGTPAGGGPTEATGGDDQPGTDPSGGAPANTVDTGDTADTGDGGDADGAGTGDGSTGLDATVTADGTGTVTGDGSTDDDSCRSPRAVAARNHEQADVTPPSPCSQGRSDEPCGDAPCDDRSRGTNKA